MIFSLNHLKIRISRDWRLSLCQEERFFSLRILNGFVVVVCLVAAAGYPGHSQTLDFNQLHVQFQESRDIIFNRAVHPDTHLLYNDVDISDSDHWQDTEFPTVADVRRRSRSLERFYLDLPQPDKVDITQCASQGGRLLSALIDCHAITQDPACIDQAKVIFEGMRTLAEVSPRNGFVARGVLPSDGQTHLISSSVDEYTLYTYGLWKYFHSSLAGTREKKWIRCIIQDICSGIEKDGFSISASNGIPAPESDIAAYRSNRASRILQIFLIGHNVTGDAHWREIYDEKLRENDHVRLRYLVDPERLKYPHVPRDQQDMNIRYDQMVYNQYSLVTLVALESDVRVKAVYLEAMRVQSRLMQGKKDLKPEELEAIFLAPNRAVVASEGAFRNDQSQAVKQALNTLTERPASCIEALAAYWTGVERGMIPEP